MKQVNVKPYMGYHAFPVEAAVAHSHGVGSIYVIVSRKLILILRVV